MTLEMPDVEPKEQKPLSKKEKQAIAHRKWRLSEKGRAYQKRRQEERKKPGK